jgi:hypothetical protein
VLVPYVSKWLNDEIKPSRSGDSSDSGIHWKSAAQYEEERPAWTYNSQIYKRWGKKGLELASKNMDKLYTFCSRRGIGLTVAVYPWPDQIDHRQRKCLQSNFWESFTFERKIEFLDLFPLFINSAEPQTVIDSYFVPGDHHWNKSGHRLVADALFQ